LKGVKSGRKKKRTDSRKKPYNWIQWGAKGGKEKPLPPALVGPGGRGEKKSLLNRATGLGQREETE